MLPLHTQPRLDAAAPKMLLEELDPAFLAAIDHRLSSIACVVPVATALFATRSASGIPQIIQMIRTRTPSEVAAKWGAGVFYGDALVYLSRAAYHLRRGYAISCWSELIPLCLQNIFCFVLVRVAAKEMAEPTGSKGPFTPPSLRSIRQWLKWSLDAVVLGALVAGMFALPPKLLPLLCLWSVPLSICSYGVQVLEALRLGAVPSDKRQGALRLRWIGSLVRVLTTARFLGGDRAAMANHAVGLVGCSLLLLLRARWDRHGPTKLQTRRALYAQLLGSETRTRPSKTLPRPIDATLHAWRSLGGLGAAAPPTVDWLHDRRAFDSIDEDGDGVLSIAELTRAVMRGGMGGSGMQTADAERLVANMMRVADIDGNNVVDFDEYKAILARTSKVVEVEGGARREEDAPPITPPIES